MSLIHDPLHELPQDHNGDSEQSAHDTAVAATAPAVGNAATQSELRWDTETRTDTVAETPVHERTSHRGRKVTAIVATAAAAVTGVVVWASNGNSKHENKGAAAPVATSTPKAGEKTTAAPASHKPSVSPSSLPTKPETVHHTGVDVTDLLSLPADVQGEMVHYNGWDILLPKKLADPSVDPELFMKEFLMLYATAATVPANSAIFDKCMQLMGHGKATDTFTEYVRHFNKNVHNAATQEGFSNPPQLMFYKAIPANAPQVKHDGVNGITSVISADGHSGIIDVIAAFPSTDLPWQSDIAKDPAKSQAIFPHFELDKLSVTTSVLPNGSVRVESIDVGSTN